MSNDALSVYSNQLDWQMSSSGHHTSQAFFDPTPGINMEIWGIFDSFTENKHEDGGHGFQKNVINCFTISRNHTLPDFTASENKKIKIVEVNKTYTINFKSKNEKGNTILWLS